MELLQKNIVDVVCAEHFGAFEWSKNQSTGSVDPAAVRAWLDLLDAAAQTNGSVFIKTWPGPETVRKTAFFLSFPYVCPEPVLAKCSFLYINGAKMPFETFCFVHKSDQFTETGSDKRRRS
eukprot:COSAG06_NODE_1490_length_9281_cov_6.074820_4_plen_121_part_00